MLFYFINNQHFILLLQNVSFYFVFFFITKYKGFSTHISLTCYMIHCTCVKSFSFFFSFLSSFVIIIIIIIKLNNIEKALNLQQWMVSMVGDASLHEGCIICYIDCQFTSLFQKLLFTLNWFDDNDEMPVNLNYGKSTKELALVKLLCDKVQNVWQCSLKMGKCRDLGSCTASNKSFQEPH